MTARVAADQVGGAQVVCPQCHHVSRTSHPFLALELEIARASTIRQALKQHTAEEQLDADNKWRCEQHKGMVRASKRLSLGRLPPVLILSLKRFSQQARGRKLTKPVRMPQCSCSCIVRAAVAAPSIACCGPSGCMEMAICTHLPGFCQGLYPDSALLIQRLHMRRWLLTWSWT